MCKSIAEGGHRCRCADPEKQEKRRRKAADRQARYMEKKRAERAATVDVNIETSPEVTPETEQAEHEAPDPENPFANFIPETEPLTAEQRDAEVKKLEDFFERKRIDPRAEWHAAPKPEPAAPADEVEAGFREFMDELRGVTHT